MYRIGGTGAQLRTGTTASYCFVARNTLKLALIRSALCYSSSVSIMFFYDSIIKKSNKVSTPLKVIFIGIQNAHIVIRIKH